MDHDFVTIQGRQVRHSTAVRDYVCGVCGSRLVVKPWLDVDAHRCDWRTVCNHDESHPADEFITQDKAWAIERRRQMDAQEAANVYAHLPPEVQAILK